MDYEEGELNDYGRGGRGGVQSERSNKPRVEIKVLWNKAQKKKEAEERRNRDRSRSRSREHSRNNNNSRHNRSERDRSRSGSRSPKRNTRVITEHQLPPTPIPPPPPIDPPTQENEVIPAILNDEDPNNVHKQCERAAAEALRRALVLLKQRGLLQGDYAVEEMAPAESTVFRPVDIQQQGVKPDEVKQDEVIIVPIPTVPIVPSATSAAMSKLLAAKLDKKETKTGVPSWYKPTAPAAVNTLKVVSEKTST